MLLTFECPLSYPKRTLPLIFIHNFVDEELKNVNVLRLTPKAIKRVVILHNVPRYFWFSYFSIPMAFFMATKCDYEGSDDSTTLDPLRKTNKKQCCKESETLNNIKKALGSILMTIFKDKQ